MARLALRGGEVARLELSDIDWRAAEVSIRGNRGRTDALPLPTDVGEAMAGYLVHARPARVPNPAAPVLGARRPEASIRA